MRRTRSLRFVAVAALVAASSLVTATGSTVGPAAASGGAAWTPRSVEAEQWISVTYGNGRFVALATNGGDRVMTSPDGITWTAHNALGVDDWTSVTYGNGLFVAVGGYQGRVMTSPDGVAWTSRPTSLASSWEHVTYGNGRFVAVAMGGTHRVMTSTNATTWTAATAAEPGAWTSVAYGNGRFVAVSEGIGGQVMTSPNGLDWTSQVPPEDGVWTSVAYGGGQFVAIARNPGLVMTSPDGSTWTSRTPADEGSNWESVTYGKGRFVAVAKYGTNQVMTSTDGTTWTLGTAAEGNAWTSVAFGNDLFVAVASNGTHRVMTSPALGLPRGAPAIGTVTPGAARATLSWTAPPSDGGSPITGYVVTPYRDGSARPSTTFDSTDTTQTVTGLANQTAYSFTVAATNANGTGPQSAASDEVMTAGPPEHPPAMGTAKAGDGQATLTWTPPGSDGGSPIDGYVVTPYIGGSAQKAKTFASTARTQVVTGLKPGTTYTFRVAAKNAVGVGPVSRASNAVTPTASIAAAVSPTRTVVGSTVTITGTVKPGSATPYVNIERYVNGRWEARGRADVSPTTGAFRTTVKPSQKGSYAFRARSAGGSVASKTFYVQVYAGMGNVSGKGEGRTKPISFSGGTYYVTASYYDTGGCYWLPSLEGITDPYAYFDLPNSDGASTRTYLSNVKPGSYYVDMLSGGTGSCTWTMTFYRQ